MFNFIEPYLVLPVENSESTAEFIRAIDFTFTLSKSVFAISYFFSFVDNGVSEIRTLTFLASNWSSS